MRTALTWIGGAVLVAGTCLAIAFTGPPQASAASGAANLPARGCTVSYSIGSGPSFTVYPHGCPTGEAVASCRIYLGHGLYTTRRFYGGAVGSGGRSTARCSGGYSRTLQRGGIRFHTIGGYGPPVWLH